MAMNIEFHWLCILCIKQNLWDLSQAAHFRKEEKSIFIDIFGDGIINKNPSAPRNNRLDINITDVGFFYGDSRVINGVNARFISH